VIPVLLRILRDPAHRDALRSANGAHLGHEAATTIAIAAAVVVCAVVVAVVALDGC
jgi:hypothetical protein